MPFFLWLRLIAGQRLTLLHRRHLGARARDVGREIGLYHGGLPEATTAALAARLLGHLTQPSAAAVRAERRIRIQSALNAMDQLDREILALRHFEQLSNSEAAQALGLSKSTASKRYIRALERLKEILSAGRGGLWEL
jgi:RNA polymerase sigma-70 factor (ECF subfamily)